MRDYTIFIPEFIAAGAAILIIALELVFPKIKRELLGYLTAAAGIGWAVAAAFYIGKSDNSYLGIIQADNFTTYFRMLAGGIVAVTGLLSATYMKDKAKTASEYYGLLLTAGIGMVYMAAARELITAYISLELLSFSLYILVGYLKRDALSSEASLKYILLGAFSSAMLLYGISLLYGVTQSTHYDAIAEALTQRGSGTTPAVVVGFMLILAGCRLQGCRGALPHVGAGCLRRRPRCRSRPSFRPFRKRPASRSSCASSPRPSSWTRSNGAGPSPCSPRSRWCSATSIAIQQKSLKRLVAYSSIGQVGYMLVVIAAIGYGDAKVGHDASSALLLHITGYVVSTLALFMALTAYYNRATRRQRPRQCRPDRQPPRPRGNAALPRTRHHRLALLVRRAALLRRLRHEALPLPGQHHR